MADCAAQGTAQWAPGDLRLAGFVQVSCRGRRAHQPYPVLKRTSVTATGDWSGCMGVLTPTTSGCESSDIPDREPRVLSPITPLQFVLVVPPRRPIESACPLSRPVLAMMMMIWLCSIGNIIQSNAHLLQARSGLCNMKRLYEVLAVEVSQRRAERRRSM